MGTSSEFQAVVLAGGKGSRMTDITSSKVKCLLPIGNYPMIWYPLNMLKRIGFQEIIVIALESAKSEICALPKKYDLDLVLDVVTLPTTSIAGSSSSHECEPMDLGTADAIRHIHDKLKANRIMIVSSDLITDIQIRHLTDLHSVHRSSLTALFAHSRLDPKSIQVPGPKSKHKKERDLIGIDHQNNNQLCYLKSEADLEEFVTLSRKVLHEHPKISMYNDLLDAHFYIVEKWVCDFIKSEERISTIKGELVPYLVKKQFSIKSDKLAGKCMGANEVDDTPHQKMQGHKINSDKKGIDEFITEDEMVLKAQDFSSWNEHSGALKPAYMNRPLRCYAYIMDKGQGTCLRANNLYTYMELNRRADRIIPAVAATIAHLVHPSSYVDTKSQIGDECLVGEESNISEKTTIKNCIIGSHCKVEPKVRLTNCILMDKITIKSGCNLQGTLVCDNAIVNERCELKDCIVGNGKHVDTGKHSNEILATDDPEMMEI